MSLSTTNSVVIHESSKAFWRNGSNITVDICIIGHYGNENSCLEVMTYNQLLDTEAPRIYLKTALINSKIDRDMLHAKVMLEKEPLLRRKKHFDADAIEKRILHYLVSEYIVSRLIISKSSDENKFCMELTTNIHEHDIVDRHTHLLDVVCPKPDFVVPFPAKQKQKISMQEFTSKVSQFQQEKDATAMELKKAHDFGREALKVSNLQQFNLSTSIHEKLDRGMSKIGALSKLKKNQAFNILQSSSLDADSTANGNSPLFELGGKMRSLELLSKEETGETDSRPLTSRGSGKMRALDDSLLLENTNSEKVYPSRHQRDNCHVKAVIGDVKMPSIVKQSSNNLVSTGATATASALVAEKNRPLFHKTIEITRSKAHNNKQQMKRKKSIQDLINGENINQLPILNMKLQVTNARRRKSDGSVNSKNVNFNDSDNDSDDNSSSCSSVSSTGSSESEYDGDQYYTDIVYDGNTNTATTPTSTRAVRYKGSSFNDTSNVVASKMLTKDHTNYISGLKIVTKIGSFRQAPDTYSQSAGVSSNEHTPCGPNSRSRTTSLASPSMSNRPSLSTSNSTSGVFSREQSLRLSGNLSRRTSGNNTHLAPLCSSPSSNGGGGGTSRQASSQRFSRQSSGAVGSDGVSNRFSLGSISTDSNDALDHNYTNSPSHAVQKQTSSPSSSTHHHSAHYHAELAPLLKVNSGSVASGSMSMLGTPTGSGGAASNLRKRMTPRNSGNASTDLLLSPPSEMHTSYPQTHTMGRLSQQQPLTPISTVGKKVSTPTSSTGNMMNTVGGGMHLPSL